MRYEPTEFTETVEEAIPLFLEPSFGKYQTDINQTFK
jgi:hypothetical protein